MSIIFWKIIKDRRISTIVYCTAAILLILMYIAMYPTILNQTAALTEVLKNYPQGFMKAFGIETLTFDHLENFLAMEQFGIIWPIMVIFLMAGFASHSLAREVEQGTAEILLSRPVSRLKIFFGRFVAALAVLLAFTVLSTLTVAPIASAFKIEYLFNHYLTTALLGFLFGAAFFSMSFMFSAMFSEKSKVAMSIGGIAVIMYVCKIVASLLDKFDWTKYLSFFYYFDANEVLVHGQLKVLPVIVFLAASIIFTAIGAWYFKKRDIAV